MADIFAEIDPGQVSAFLEQYRDLEEEKLTEEDRERILQENPLETGFRPVVVLNGKQLRGAEGNGLCWLPESCREADAGGQGDGEAGEVPEIDNDGDLVEGPAVEEYLAADPYEEERRLLDHYGLDPDKAWSINRWSFSWATKRPPELRSLSLTMKRDRACVPGIRFTVRGPGDRIPFIHPSTGTHHVLTVLEYREEEMDWRAFDAPEGMEQEERRRFLRRMGEWEYPTHLMAMTYDVSPELPRGELQIRDGGDDRPRRIPSREPEDRFLPEAKNDACVMAGSSAGPTDPQPFSWRERESRAAPFPPCILSRESRWNGGCSFMSSGWRIWRWSFYKRRAGNSQRCFPLFLLSKYGKLSMASKISLKSSLGARRM